MPQKLKITQDPEKPVAPEIMAQAIVSIADSAKKLISTRLTRRAIVVLIHNSLPSGGKTDRPTRTQISAVLDAAAELETAYLKPLKGKQA